MKPQTLLLLVGLLGLAFAARHVHAALGTDQAVESYYADGSLKTRAAIDDGRREGPYAAFYADGTLMTEGQFDGDERFGRWVWYRKDGSVDSSRSGHYEDGERVGGL